MTWKRTFTDFISQDYFFYQEKAVFSVYELLEVMLEPGTLINPLQIHICSLFYPAVYISDTSQASYKNIQGEKMCIMWTLAKMCIKAMDHSSECGR